MTAVKNSSAKKNLPLKGRKIVVTGAGGFIGSHLTALLLERGAKVRALVRYNSSSNPGFLSEIPGHLHKNLDIVFGNVEDQKSVQELISGTEWVFHLAALIGIPYSYQAPSSYLHTNVLGTHQVLEAALGARVKKVMITSTSEVYGTALRTPMDESHPLQAQSPYAASKIAADVLAQSYARSFELPVVIVRPFNTFGPRQSMRAVIPTIMMQTLSGKEIRLGDLTPVRDLNFVENTIEGFLACAESGIPDGRVYNLATGKGHTIGEVANAILKIAGKRLPIVCEATRMRPRASEVRQLIGDARRACDELNWKPRQSLIGGLEKTWEWLVANRHRYPDGKTYIR